MSEVMTRGYGREAGGGCGCDFCRQQALRSNRPGALPPVLPAVPRGTLDWSEMPGRIHVADESESLPFFGLMFAIVGSVALGIFLWGLVMMGGIVLAQALWHAGLHSAGLLHQLRGRLG